MDLIRMQFLKGSALKLSRPAYLRRTLIFMTEKKMLTSGNASPKRGRGDFSRPLEREAKASPTHGPTVQ